MARVKNLPKGIKNHRAKLDDDKVREIRFLYPNSIVTHESLAASYGVTKKAIWDILHNKTWTHVK